MRADWTDIHRHFTVVECPSTLTQHGHDFTDYGPHWEQVRTCERWSIPGSGLHWYVFDLLIGVQPQRDLLEYLLPPLLRLWHNTLHGVGDPREHTGEVLAQALQASRWFEADLSADQVLAAQRLVGNSWLDAADRQTLGPFAGNYTEGQRRPTQYRWFSALAWLCLIHPALPSLWREWWRMETRGHACSVLQLCSTLMYPVERNPVFKPWTPDKGGGAPTLWDEAHSNYGDAFLPSNVEFLRTELTSTAFAEVVRRGADRLRDSADFDVARVLLEDLDACRPRFERRVSVLPIIASGKMTYEEKQDLWA